MKKRLLSIVGVLLTSISLWAQESMKSSDRDGSRTCIEIIYSFSLSDSTICYKDTIQLERDTHKNIKPYLLKGTVPIHDSYEVRAQWYNNWQDPGDFHVLSIYRGDSLVYEFSDPFGFCKIPNSLKIHSSYPNDYFHIFKMDNGATVIVLEGYPYCSLPPSLAVFLFYQGSAHLVYYQEEKFLINNISVSSGGYFEIELHDAVPSGDPDYNPNSYYLKATPSGMGLYK